MKLCNELINTPAGLLVCQAEAGKLHSHHATTFGAHCRDIKQGDKFKVGKTGAMHLIEETDYAALEELEGWLRSENIAPEDLDDIVHDSTSNPASRINNAGLTAQVAHFIDIFGSVAQAKQVISGYIDNA